MGDFRSRCVVLVVMGSSLVGWGCFGGGSRTRCDDCAPVHDAGATPPPADGAVPPGDRYWCCIDSAYYTCATDAELDRCIGFDYDGCVAACAFDDFMCMEGCLEMFSMSRPGSLPTSHLGGARFSDRGVVDPACGRLPAGRRLRQPL